MNNDELQLIIEEGEGYRIEFKESMTNIISLIYYIEQVISKRWEPASIR